MGSCQLYLGKRQPFEAKTAGCRRRQLRLLAVCETMSAKKSYLLSPKPKPYTRMEDTLASSSVGRIRHASLGFRNRQH